MNIRVRALRLVDCGPLRDTRIDFASTGSDAAVRVIGGANGSGKTSVLEAIVSLLRLIEPPIKRGGFVLGEAVIGSATLGPPVTTRFDVRGSILGRSRFAQLDLDIDGKAVTIAHGTRPSDYVLPDGAEEYHTAPDKPFVEHTYGPVTYQLMQSLQEATAQDVDLGLPPSMPSGLPTTVYFPHYRVLRPVEGDQVHREPSVYRWVHEFSTVTSFAGSLDSAFIWLDYAEPEGYAWIRELADGLDLAGKTFSVDRKSLQVMVNTASGGQHPLALLSSGEQNILIFAIELGRRLLPGSIVLIDEIENSLHPAFQMKLGRILLEMQKKTPFQLIVTTHAPALLDVFGADRTLLLTEF